jgi:co-chaperonin GroES (HSP10)
MPLPLQVKNKNVVLSDTDQENIYRVEAAQPDSAECEVGDLVIVGTIDSRQKIKGKTYYIAKASNVIGIVGGRGA